MADRDSDPRKQLLAQLRALRSRVDPAVLAKVLDGLPGWERYDREAAQTAVALFLENHKDSKQFLEDLRQGLSKQVSDD